MCLRCSSETWHCDLSCEDSHSSHIKAKQKMLDLLDRNRSAAFEMFGVKKEFTSAF